MVQTFVQVRIWDAVTHSLLRMTRLDTPASSVDYSPDGELLVVGLGRRGSESGSQQKAKTEPGEACRPSPSTESKTGGFLVLHASDFALAHEIKDAKHVSDGSCGCSFRFCPWFSRETTRAGIGTGLRGKTRIRYRCSRLLSSCCCGAVLSGVVERNANVSWHGAVAAISYPLTPAAEESSLMRHLRVFFERLVSSVLPVLHRRRLFP